MERIFFFITYIYFMCISFCPDVCVCYWFLNKSEENMSSLELKYEWWESNLGLM